MTMDFSTMDGYQFEDYISSLFHRLGFEVESTSYSNDGGVDLVATFKQPIFSGKYIIQCKNWTGPVGQPEVRDLYGVVMDQRANKGILITPSDYTQQAYDFAQGKNIELINGLTLRKLIADDSLEQTTRNVPSNNFAFRDERYLYYQNNIAEEPNNVSNYLQMIGYLRELVKEQNAQICTMELFDDIISWTDKLINRCFKTASKLTDKENALLFKVEAFIHTGRLAEATEHLLRIKRFRVIGLHASDYHDIIHYTGSILAWNLLAAFKQINYVQGCRLIIDKLKDSDNSWFKKDYYETGILGNLFVYPTFAMNTIGSGKTKHLEMFGFKKCDIKKPTFFYENFYKKSPFEYALEIHKVFKLHGML